MTSYARDVPHRADADLDDLVDLDDAGQDRPDDDRGRAPGARLSRWARSRWVVPVPTTAVVLLVGLAGLQQARASVGAELVSVQRMTSVQLGSATVVFSGSPDGAERDEDGRVLQQVQVGVRNTGDEDLSLLPVSTSVDHAQLAPGAEDASLRAGTGGVLTFELAVDCDAVPLAVSSYSADDAPPVSTDVLRLAVTADGETTRRDYLLPDTGWGGLDQQLAYACSPNGYGQVLSTSTEEDADGRLLVRLSNGSDEPVPLRLQAPALLRAAADPALPAEVPAGGSLEVALSLDPDCTGINGLGVSSRRDPYALAADLVAQVDDGSWSSYLDTTASAVWVARQVALRCG